MTVDHMHEMVERFNRDLIGLPIPEQPTILSFKRGEFRLGHLREELKEIEDGLLEENLEYTVDGLLDLVYVALGALVEMGITAGAAFEEVHAANMAKERGSLSKRPGSLGYDAVKPEGWTPPELAPYLNLTRRDIRFSGDIVNTFVKKPETVQDILRQPVLTVTDHTPTPKPKILVIGHARHGKDTVCEILRDRHGFRFNSSSNFCAEHIVFPVLKDKYGYKNVAQCYEDRVNHRGEWYDLIRTYNKDDPARLAKAILAENDVYCGMRSAEELDACQVDGLFQHIVWVDRSDHVRPEGLDSCTVDVSMAEWWIDNNGDLASLRDRVDHLVVQMNWPLK